MRITVQMNPAGASQPHGDGPPGGGTDPHPGRKRPPPRPRLIPLWFSRTMTTVEKAATRWLHFARALADSRSKSIPQRACGLLAEKSRGGDGRTRTGLPPHAPPPARRRSPGHPSRLFLRDHLLATATLLNIEREPMSLVVLASQSCLTLPFAPPGRRDPWGPATGRGTAPPAKSLLVQSTDFNVVRFRGFVAPVVGRRLNDD